MKRDDGNGFRSVRQQLEGTLFDQDPAPAIAAGKAGLAQSEAHYERYILALIPVAQELARKAGFRGITVADIREVGESRGLIPPGIPLDWLPAVPRRAGLKATGGFRRSHVLKTHGNLGQVYRSAA